MKTLVSSFLFIIAPCFIINRYFIHFKVLPDLTISKHKWTQYMLVQWNLSNPTHQGTREMCQNVQGEGILRFYFSEQIYFRTINFVRCHRMSVNSCDGLHKSTVIPLSTIFQLHSYIKSWWSVLLVINLTQVTNKLYHIMLIPVHLAWVGFEFTLVVMGTDCI